MRQILFFALAALALAFVMPQLMGGVGKRPVEMAAPAKRGEPAPAPKAPPRTATVRDDARGHFQVEGVVDGRRIDFLVDTGASSVTLRERDADRLGIHPSPREYTGRASTANGIVKYAPVRLPSLEVNGIRIYDVQAAVLPDEALSTNLLGMSFLSRVRRFEMSNGRLVMEQ